MFVSESLFETFYPASSPHVAYKCMSTLWLVTHVRLLPSALWRQAGSCKQVGWGLPLCGLVMRCCLNSTKIRRRWQCRAQCSGPCLRIAPMPLIPMSLGQPPAVFRSVYSTRHDRTYINHISNSYIWELCDCYYVLYCCWLRRTYYKFPMKNLKGHEMILN